MSTDDERPDVPAVPRTRAEMRAAREAEARAAEAAALRQAQGPSAVEPKDSVVAPKDSVAEPKDSVAEPVEAPTDVDRAALRQAQGPSAVEPACSDEAPATEPAVPLAPKGWIAEPENRVAEPENRVAEPEDWVAEPVEAPRTERVASRHAQEPAAALKPAKPRPSRRFVLTIAAVLGVLVLVGTGLGVVSLLQGPRITNVQADPGQAIESSGSRVILTANQSLTDIDPAQVTVEPAAPFTVDAAGRGIGLRFTVPLDDDTKYTITVADVGGAGGGPTSTLTTSFTTPTSNIFLLTRDVDGDDKIFRTDLTGEKAVPVFAAPEINDFRATSTKLVVAVGGDDGSTLLVMNRDGSDQRELPLPGTGYVGAIQVSERGGLVGYSYSDVELSDTEGRASVLVTQSLTGDDEPQVTEVAGVEASVFAWQFVPDSSAVLFIDFDGALSLLDRSTDAGVQSLGLAANIQGVSRGTYTAIIERLDGAVVELNLTDGSEVPLAASDPDYGVASTITPFPGGTLRHVVSRDENGIPEGQAIIRVGDDGAAEPLVEVGATDSILQACASPSGQYAAVVIAPDLANNPYDGMLLPLPQTMETHLIDLRTGDEIVALTGFDASWCQTAPRF